MIDPLHRKFELNILISSLRRMLILNGEDDDDDDDFNHEKNYKSIESTLSIIEILIQDHQKLGPLILPHASYDILKFLK